MLFSSSLLLCIIQSNRRSNPSGLADGGLPFGPSAEFNSRRSFGEPCSELVNERQDLVSLDWIMMMIIRRNRWTYRCSPLRCWTWGFNPPVQAPDQSNPASPVTNWLLCFSVVDNAACLGNYSIWLLFGGCADWILSPHDSKWWK